MTLLSGRGPHWNFRGKSEWREDLKQMKLNGPGRWKVEPGRNIGWKAKHAWLYSDLLQALKGEHFMALGSQRKGLPFSAEYSEIPLRQSKQQSGQDCT